ncbi:hypothetical protein SVA_0713 [Sulfurifustis variabilis]|uniref:DUF3501 family protein n=2 Tax=Sulfurifustis variabilis TaxID=1675686 RepID=A0A1B4V428_9GAMM|nr:hypothetical protein SVA_0713 [Sulfurifustis variabilis]
MQKLNPDDLYSLEQYARVRPDFRREVLDHKKNRQIAIGPNATLYFEDRLTMQYQVQEMLRIERIFEPEGIAEELEAYNPLIPDGSNWKATFMMEYPDIEERRAALARLKGVEDRVWMKVDGFERVYAIADEDLEREDENKTSSVHFLRFELAPEMVRAVKQGAAIAAGIDHEAYRQSVDPVPPAVRDSLAKDLS